jgi:hypothetical protein
VKLAVLLLTGPSLPRVTHLSREWVHRLTTRVAGFFDDQSGGREILEFRVFDWFRVPVADAEWAGLGWSLGDVARPLVEQGLNVDLSPFTHFALVIDQFSSKLAAVAPGKPYVHFGAQDLTPALYAHELGHFFGAHHARRDDPIGAVEYGDASCIMGAEGGKWSFPALDFQFDTDFGQGSWRYCTLCKGLYYDGDPVQKGVCPGAATPGTGHAPGPYNFVLPHDRPADSGQPDWRFCTKCYLLFFDHQVEISACPAGGTHAAALNGGFNFSLPHDVAPGPGQTDWRFCGKCRAMFYNGYPDKGACPAGAGHAREAKSYDFALPHDLRPHNASGPGMAAPALLGCQWLDLGHHGADVGAPLRSRPGEMVVELGALRGAPRGDAVAMPVVAHADGLSDDRLVLEHRVADGWDRAFPSSSLGVGGWVLAHLTSGQAPDLVSLLIAQLSARVGATTFIPEAFLFVAVTAVDSTKGTVSLRLRSEGWPPFGDLEGKVTLPEQSEDCPAITSDGERVFLAWRGLDDQVNLLVSEDDGATFGGKHTSV